MKLPFVSFVVLVFVGPAVMEHPDTVMTLGLVGLEILHDPSWGEKPVPFTRTSPPMRWLPGLSVIEGLVTVNVAVAKSALLLLSVTVIVYVPGFEPIATVKPVAARAPAALIVHE